MSHFWLCQNCEWSKKIIQIYLTLFGTIMVSQGTGRILKQINPLPDDWLVEMGMRICKGITAGTDSLFYV